MLKKCQDLWINSVFRIFVWLILLSGSFSNNTIMESPPDYCLFLTRKTHAVQEWLKNTFWKEMVFIRLLMAFIRGEREIMNVKDTTIIISCAGMGKRLGFGKPKALIDIVGEPLIIRQLELMKKCDDIRIVVGYQAESIIRLVQTYRSDIQFVYNNDYKTTGTAASFSAALPGSREYVVAMDGDLLVNPYDFNFFLCCEGECVGGCIPTTDNPVLMEVDMGRVIQFSRERGVLEWTGLAKIKANKLSPQRGHVYQMIEPLLPIPVMKMRTREIDTMHDYDNAIKWFLNHYND